MVHLVAVAAVLGACRALFEPAEDAILPSLVPDEQLATAIAANNARSSVGQMGGTVLGGVLFGLTRWAPFLLDLVTHVVAFITLVFLRVPLGSRLPPHCGTSATRSPRACAGCGSAGKSASRPRARWR